MKLIDKFIKLRIIDKKDIDLYEYSIGILKNYIFFSIIILSCNFFTGDFDTTIIFLIIFFSIRKYYGGLHMENSTVCLFLSVLLTLIIPYLSTIIYFHPISIIVMQIIISIFLIALPIIDTPQKTVSESRKKSYKNHSIYLLFFYIFLNILFVCFGFKNISMILLLSIFTSYLSVLLGYLKYKIHQKKAIISENSL